MLCAQEITTKEWLPVECDMSLLFLEEDMWGMQAGSNCYIYNRDNQARFMLYQFTPAQLETTCQLDGYVEAQFKPIIMGEYCYYGYEDDKYIPTLEYIKKFSLSDGKYVEYYNESYKDIGNGFLVTMNNKLYFLSQNEGGRLYKISCRDTDMRIVEDDKDDLDYSPVTNTPIVILNNICYYFSEDGLCYVDISGDEVDNKKIDVVTSTDAQSTLVTDNQNRIWIISESDGVIEYNIQKNTAETIAKFPSSKGDRVNIYKRACFYLENKLYYIDKTDVSSLDVTPKEDPDNPDPDNPDPDNPTRPHDQSGHTCGCMGLEFVLTLAVLSLCLRHRH